LKGDLNLIKSSIDSGKAEKQKKNWEIQQLDIEIKDLIDKVGHGYLLNGVATYQ
jgi:hypothetical protein